MYSPSDPQPVKGREAYRKSAEEQHKTFPDIEYKIPNIMAKSSTVAVELVVSSTFKGPLRTPQGAIPPTGRRVELRLASFNRVNPKGLIAETHLYFDSGAARQQLGLKE
jgi:predicted ester cyclase